MYKRRLGRKHYESNTHTFKRDLIILTIAITIYQFGTHMMIGQLGNYMRSLNVDEKTLGMISAVGSLAGVLALAGGQIGKRIGVKWLVVLNHLISLPYPLLCAVGSTTPVFVIASVFSRLPFMFNFGISVYFISYRCKIDKIRALLMMSATHYSMGMIAPTIGGRLIESIGMRKVLLLTALCYLICVLITLFLTEECYIDEDKEIVKDENPLEVNKPSNRGKGQFPNAVLIALFSCRFLCDISGPLDGINMVTLFYEDIGMGTMQRSYAASFMSLGVVGLLLITSKLTKVRRIIVLLLLSVMGILANISFLTGSAGIVIAFAVFRGSRNSLTSLCQNIISEKMPNEKRVTLMSVYAATYSVMQFVSTKIGSSIYQINIYLPFILETAITVAWLCAIWIAERNYGEL